MEEVKKKRKEKQQRNKEFFHSAFISKVPFSGACTREASSIAERTFRRKRSLNQQQLSSLPDVPAGNPGKLIAYWATRHGGEAPVASRQRWSLHLLPPVSAWLLSRCCNSFLLLEKETHEANWQFWLRQLGAPERGREGRTLHGRKDGWMD